MKKFILAVLAVFVSWEILDYLIHSVILMGIYEATASLWRPQGEMKMGLMIVVTLLSALFFVWIYYKLISKSLNNGLLFGLFYGLATGIPMGYGTYSVMPIPYALALGWFLGALVESVVAGLLVGLIIKEEKPQ